MIKKSRKINQTKDRKIKNKRGATPGIPHNENLKPTIENKGNEGGGGAVSFSLFGAPLLFSFVFNCVLQIFIVWGPWAPPLSCS